MRALINLVKKITGIDKFLLKAFFLKGTLPEMYRCKLPWFIVCFYDYIKLLYIARDIKHVFGVKKITFGIDEAVVLCLVRDGETWIRDFIEHYLKKGFKHIVFLDNGSSDNTLEIAKKYPNITILKTSVPFKDNNILLRRYLVMRFAKKRWSLTVDIDELWDYPFSDKVDLGSLLKYLRKQDSNALVAQILDMFMAQLPSEKATTLKTYEYYDISCIEKEPLTKSESLKRLGFSSKTNLSSRINVHAGGIRDQLVDHKGFLLTKMPLLFYGDRLQPFTHQHFSNNVRIADISSLLLHYKFTHLFKDQVRNAVENRNYANESYDYVRYANMLKKNTSLELKKPTARKLISVDQLIEEDFLVVSLSYRELLK